MKIYQFEVLDNFNNLISMDKFHGKILLIVNVASKCGYTKQYNDLVTLDNQYRDKGLVILAFPCNQFGGQEPSDHDEISSQCELNFKVKFPIFQKINVNGKEASPLFNYLKKEAPGIAGTTSIKWNFTKFLINKTGDKIMRYSPQENPLDLIPQIEIFLNQEA